MTVKVGFIGLGIMGSEMAGHIADAGYPLVVYNRTVEKAYPLRDRGAILADSPKAVGEGSDVVCICAGDGQSVREIVFGLNGNRENALIAGLKKGSVIIDHSTIAPQEAELLAKDLALEGISFLDAPVTGGQIGAQNGTLTTMVGGDQKILENVRPILQTYSKKVAYIGSSGSGQRLKAVNQIGAIGASALVSELMNFALSQGLDLTESVEVLKEGAAGSFALNFFGPKIQRGDFEPGFSVKHSAKDLGIVLREAAGQKVALPITAKVYENLKHALEIGLAEKGNHILFQVLKEKL